MGEAMQIKKLVLFIFLVPSLIFSQDINIQSLKSMSDENLKMYMIQAQQRGYTLDQIKIMAKAQGVSDIEMSNLEKRIMDIEVNTSNKDIYIDNTGDITSKFGIDLTEDIEEKESFEEAKSNEDIVFGSSFFNNPNITYSPSLNIATPESYELGPGDEIAISIWGAAQNEYISKISREGYLKIERIGPVYLSGLSISEAKVKLKNRLSKIYSGINANYNKVFFDISLLNSRSIVINIAGNVIGPGTYTLSSLTSPLNALYAAGGPDKNGSYREIKIIRGGQEVHSIDLYDYFVKGSLKSFSLRDQDVILVPTYKNRIFLKGEFKKIGIFELKDSETISDLLFYNGGISSSGVKNNVLISRVDDFSKRIETVEKKSFEEYFLQDGDVISARGVGNEIKNAVYIEGSVVIPGQYELNKNLNVSSLVMSAGGFKEDALRERAYLIREVDGFQQDVISINLTESMNLKKTYPLKANDKLIIASKEELKSTKNITISGEVNQPGDYPFFEGSTVIDLILMAKGVTDKGSVNGVTIYRSTYDKNQINPVETFYVDLDESFKNLQSDKNIKLKVNDLVVVRSKLGYQSKEYITVRGLVKKEGNYALKTNNYSVFDLIKDFDGFLPDAEVNGVKIIRNSSNGEIIEIGLNIDKILKSNGNINEHNVVLKNGDEIIVPRIDNSIEILGEIQKQTAVTYKRGLTTSSAINKAGGFGENAKRSKVYVTYQNGTIASTKRFLFFRNYPKLLPGSKIFVPKKIEKTNKTTAGEIVGYTTSLVSIFALIKSF